MQSLLGKFVGGLTALVGVFTITLPIPIVVNSFAGFYKNRLWRNEVALKKRQRVQKERELIKKEIEQRVFRGELDIDQVIAMLLLYLYWKYSDSNRRDGQPEEQPRNDCCGYDEVGRVKGEEIDRRKLKLDSYLFHILKLLVIYANSLL